MIKATIIAGRSNPTGDSHVANWFGLVAAVIRQAELEAQRGTAYQRSHAADWLASPEIRAMREQLAEVSLS